MTSHRGSGFHGPEGVRQAGMPGVEPARLLSGWPRDQGRRGGRMSLALDGAGDMGPADRATDTVTGAEARSLPPPDAKGSGWVDEPPIIKLDWWSRPSRLPDFFNGPDAKAGVATVKRVHRSAYPRPAKRGRCPQGRDAEGGPMKHATKETMASTAFPDPTPILTRIDPQRGRKAPNAPVSRSRHTSIPECVCLICRTCACFDSAQL